jgi:hypothetical protein
MEDFCKFSLHRDCALYNYRIPSFLWFGQPSNGLSANALYQTNGGITDSYYVDECVDEVKSLAQASASWWFLFLARQSTTLGLAGLLQVIVIDFGTLRSRLFPKILGTTISLGVAQSKGWPCILFFWALLDMILIYGSRPFSRHWMHWQTWISLMNPVNPSGNVTENQKYKTTIFVSIGLSVAVTIKRTMIGNFVGKRVVSKCTILFVFEPSEAFSSHNTVLLFRRKLPP